MPAKPSPTLTAPAPFDALRTDDLISRVREGDHDAWREVYRRYRPFLLLTAKRMAGTSHEDAEDAVQSGFLHAWSDIEGFEYRGAGSLRVWLRKVVINRNLDKLRKLRTIGCTYSGARGNFNDTGVFARTPEVNGSTPSEFVARQEAQARLTECMEACLDHDEQELIILRHFEQLPMTQVADVMEKDRRTLDRWHTNVIEKLQRELGGLK